MMEVLLVLLGFMVLCALWTHRFGLIEAINTAGLFILYTVCAAAALVAPPIGIPLCILAFAGSRGSYKRHSEAANKAVEKAWWNRTPQALESVPRPASGLTVGWRDPASPCHQCDVRYASGFEACSRDCQKHRDYWAFRRQQSRMLCPSCGRPGKPGANFGQVLSLL
jgi:hypothetical protein